MGGDEVIQGNYVEKEEPEKLQYEDKATILQSKHAAPTLPTWEPLTLSRVRLWEPFPEVRRLIQI